MTMSMLSFDGTSIDSLRSRFMFVLPRIQTHAAISFRHVRCAQTKAEHIAETVGLAWVWFVRLCQRGKDPTAFISALATLAVRSVRSGRRVCGSERAKDVLSSVAQRRHEFMVESLPCSIRTSIERLYGDVDAQHHLDAYEERLTDNTVTPPDDQAAFRIDFPAWLETLTPRERRMIAAMAQNERTRDLCKMFEVSPGRISQMRREFHDGWTSFCGEHDPSSKAEPIFI